MVYISLLSSVLVYMTLQILFELIFGKEPATNYLSDYYEEVSGKSKRIKKQIKRKKVKSYALDKKVYIKYSLPIAIVIFVIGLMFFKNIGSAFLFSLGGFIYPKIMIRKRLEKRRELLNYQFKEVLQSVSNSLKSGSSLASALERCLIELKQIYKNQIDKPIIDEFEIIVYDIRIGKSISETLIAFKDRVKMEDVDSFVNAAIITERTGGNLTEVMKNVSDMINDKIGIKREIATLTAGKRSEAKLLSFMPVSIVMLLSFISPSYMAPMYETVIGKILMTTGIILLIINYMIGKKIVNIDI